VSDYDYGPLAEQRLQQGYSTTCANGGHPRCKGSRLQNRGTGPRVRCTCQCHTPQAVAADEREELERSIDETISEVAQHIERLEYLQRKLVALRALVRRRSLSLTPSCEPIYKEGR
jgi:hypothetical protein